MDDELFDVFDEKPPIAADLPKKQTSRKKRSLSGEVKSPSDKHDAVQDDSMGGIALNGQGEDVGDVNTNGTGEERNQKRQRREEDAQPVVTDAVETQISREVAASAGLQAQKADSTAPLLLTHQVRHQTANPPNMPGNGNSIRDHVMRDPPARAFDFELDPFQRTAIAAIENNESVLVSAHTSAGKTVVAEYAIAQCLQNNQRIIYTSPIKALSNQKFRDFKEIFGDVGLMTGDVTINPTASCLVMTTEILRSMLYRGSEIMREVAWVVFDEVHYLRDASRGVVWEETIIMLPDKVRYVFLSATIPNAMQFAEWIAQIHSQPCHIVYTDFRPTPLQHYFFPAGADGIHLVVDERGVFREENFNKAMMSISEKAGDDGTDPMAKRRGKGKDKKTNKGGRKDGPSDIYKIVKMIMMKSYNPVIVFSFAKRECENYALQMAQLAFNSEDEKQVTVNVFKSAIEGLSEEDRELPQVQHLLPLLKRGIGIHHSGLLPILKETIEILFQEGLIKVLFATETFSIGLNMPAKTVVFTSVRKFDGVQTRWLTPTEFIQMSGRAGRRGIDERGIVIMMIDEQMDPAVAKNIVRGEQDKLNSAFYLGYNMILNLMRVEGIGPEYMLEHCFLQYQNAASTSDLQKRYEMLQQKRLDMIIENEDEIREYYNLRQNISTYTAEMKEVITDQQYLSKFLQPGRMVKVKWGDHDFGWGATVNWLKVKASKNQREEDIPKGSSMVIDVCVVVASDSTVPTPGTTKTLTELPPGIRPPGPGDRGRMEIVPVMNGAIDSVAHVRVFLPPELRNQEQKNLVRKGIEEVSRRFPDGLAILDPVENMGIKDDGFKRTLRKIEVMEHKLLNNPLHASEKLPALYEQYHAKVELTKEIKEVKKKMEDAHSVLRLDELKNRKRVLRRLGFISEADVVQLKARVACEISTGDELMLSELLFNRFFNELTPEQCAAVLSCFIFEENSKEEPALKEELAKPYREILAQARTIAKVSQESKIVINEEEYVKSFKYQLMEVVYAWTCGAGFATICKMTDVYEGSLIRLFRRLEELMRQMSQAAKVMGSEELEKKFEIALTKTRRDLVAQQSLYV